MDTTTYNRLLQQRTDACAVAIEALMTTLTDCIADGYREQAKDIQDRINVLFKLANSNTMEMDMSQLIRE